MPFAFRLIDLGAACRIEVWSAGRWQGAADIPAAGPRRRVMHFNPVHTDKVRLIAAKPSNRPTVCEIRLYNQPTPQAN